MDIEMIKIHARQLVKLIGAKVDLEDSRQNTLERGILNYVNRGRGDKTAGYYVNGRNFSVSQVGIILGGRNAGGIINLNYPIGEEVGA